MQAFEQSWLAAAVAAVAAAPAWTAGALAALAVLLGVLAFRHGGAVGLIGALPRIALAAIVPVAAVAFLAQSGERERAAERRALEARASDLAARATAPGAPFACLTGEVGDQIETACEKAIFASPESAAAAVAFVSARLTLLADARAFAGGDPGGIASFAGLRRAIELDRYGIAAHVLATRDGCSVDHCPAFALLNDTGALKANIKARAFDAYVERYAPGWIAEDKPQPAEKPVEPPSPPQASAPAAPPPAGPPVASRYDFPSAASIPPVSIMAAEPPLPPGAGAQPAPGDTGQTVGNAPVPPKRPQGPAPPPAARP